MLPPVLQEALKRARVACPELGEVVPAEVEAVFVEYRARGETMKAEVEAVYREFRDLSVEDVQKKDPAENYFWAKESSDETEESFVGRWISEDRVAGKLEVRCRVFKKKIIELYSQFEVKGGRGNWSKPIGLTHKISDFDDPMRGSFHQYAVYEGGITAVGQLVHYEDSLMSMWGIATPTSAKFDSRRFAVMIWIEGDQERVEVWRTVDHDLVARYETITNLKDKNKAVYGYSIFRDGDEENFDGNTEVARLLSNRFERRRNGKMLAIDFEENCIFHCEAYHPEGKPFQYKFHGYGELQILSFPKSNSRGSSTTGALFKGRRRKPA